MDRKSTSGCCFTLRSAMVSWCNRKQTTVALSAVEAEYIALCVAVRKVVWLRKLLANLFGHEMDSTIIWQSTAQRLLLSTLTASPLSMADGCWRPVGPAGNPSCGNLHLFSVPVVAANDPHGSLCQFNPGPPLQIASHASSTYLHLHT
jgi:hypothetical protein